MTELSTRVLVVGGGLGGVAAALSAARRGSQVVLTVSSDWLGGQLTSQAVPPDEHSWIEQFGCTESYRAVRDGCATSTAGTTRSPMPPGTDAASTLAPAG